MSRIMVLSELLIHPTNNFAALCIEGCSASNAVPPSSAVSFSTPKHNMPKSSDVRLLMASLVRRSCEIGCCFNEPREKHSETYFVSSVDHNCRYPTSTESALLTT